jgi:hypothetical protein
MQRQYTVQAQLPIRPYPWLHPKMSVVRCVCSVALPTPSIRLVAPCFFGLVTCVLVPLLQQLAGSFAQVVVGFCKFWHGRRVGTWQRTWHGHGGFDLQFLLLIYYSFVTILSYHRRRPHPGKPGGIYIGDTRRRGRQVTDIAIYISDAQVAHKSQPQAPWVVLPVPVPPLVPPTQRRRSVAPPG